MGVLVLLFFPSRRFWAGPVAVLVCNLRLAPWTREKIANGVFCAINFCCEAVLLVSLSVPLPSPPPHGAILSPPCTELLFPEDHDLSSPALQRFVALFWMFLNFHFYVIFSVNNCRCIFRILLFCPQPVHLISRERAHDFS